MQVIIKRNNFSKLWPIFQKLKTEFFTIIFHHAGAVLRKLSNECGAMDPESLRGTFMRKHMASVAITMELGDNAISELSDFMGHAEEVHRKYYRINPKERQIIHISQYLEAATGHHDESDDEVESYSMDVTSNIIQNSESMHHSDGSTQAPMAQQHSTQTLSNVKKQQSKAKSQNGEKGETLYLTR